MRSCRYRQLGLLSNGEVTGVLLLGKVQVTSVLRPGVELAILRLVTGIPEVCLLRISGVELIRPWASCAFARFADCW